MFRPHDVTQARAESDARHEQADAKFKTYSDQWFVECQLLSLQADAELGLMDCYDSFENSLWDFYPSFSWKGDRMLTQIRMLLDDPRYPEIAAKIKAEFDFDMTAELNKAFTDPLLLEEVQATLM